MKANYFQSWYGVTTWGESHGPAVGVVLDDVKPGIVFPLDAIQQALDARRPAGQPGSTSRREPDRIQVLSGVLDGITTGTPICLIVYNRDARSSDYEALSQLFRPGHGDFSWFAKFKIFDHRGGGRASGRETLARVAAAGLSAEILGDIRFHFCTRRIGPFTTSQDAPNTNPLHWPDADTLPQLQQWLDELRTAGESAGGIVECRITGMPAGLGDPVFEKLEANLAKAVLSIGSIKGIEFGDGFALASLTGSQANDQLTSQGFVSNHAGGTLGGISTGQDIVFRCVIKPVPSVAVSQRTINRSGEEATIAIQGRHDVCIIPRVIPVIQAMCSLVLADAIAHQRLIDPQETSLPQLREAIDKIDEDILMAIYRRQQIAAAIGQLKAQENRPVYDPQREAKLLASLQEKAATLNIEPTLVEEIWRSLLKASKAMQ